MTELASLYRPDHDEAARQAFVAALKFYANGPMEDRLAQLWDSGSEGHASDDSGDGPGDGHDEPDLDTAIARFEPHRDYGLWANAAYVSQDLLWEAVGQTVTRVKPDFEARLAALAGRAPLGSLVLDPDLVLPEPIASREIHRQPGGYFGETGATDLTAGLLYFASIELYRTAKGLGTGAATGAPAMAPLILKVLGEKAPGLAPRRILDIGCGTGTETLGFARAFPGAQTHGLDLSAPLLRFAHLWAEEQRQAVDYRQANAAHTPYPDGHFDLIVSHILFHETSHELLPQIMAEARRLLAPGGVFLNADVAYQPHRLTMPKRVTNAWQVEHNGEPFWRGFAETDMASTLAAAGFSKDEIFADYVPLGSGHYLMFGAVSAG